MHSPAPTPQRGVSLIEALVALAVMAFGMLGIVGVQSTLRLNSDVAKQRSEAVRLAQQAIEDSRSFVQVALPATAGVPNYGTVVTETQVIDPTLGYTTNIGASFVLPNYVTNTSYTLVRNVPSSPVNVPLATLPYVGSSLDPPMKIVGVTATWADRTGAAETVILNTVVARIMPELSGTLALAASVDANGVPTRLPLPAGRNLNIPTQAVNFGSSGSGYVPPGRVSGDTTAFLFNNTTGLITLCTSTLADNSALATYFAANGTSPLVCSTANAWPLSGYVAFALTAADALAPNGTALALSVSVAQTYPSPPATVVCYTAAPQAAYVAYLCAVPVLPTAAAPHPAYAWSGTSSVSGLAGPPQVCRYTYSVTPLLNWQHPNPYTDVTGPLSQQNFLALPTGTACPTLSGTQTTASP